MFEHVKHVDQTRCWTRVMDFRCPRPASRVHFCERPEKANLARVRRHVDARLTIDVANK